MWKFLHRFSAHVTGVLNGLDRIRFPGTKRLLASVGGMIHYFRRQKLLNKDFKAWAFAMRPPRPKLYKSAPGLPAKWRAAGAR
jgi:hypothetical protein